MGIDFGRQFSCELFELTFAIASRQLWGGEDQRGGELDFDDGLVFERFDPRARRDELGDVRHPREVPAQQPTPLVT